MSGQAPEHGAETLYELASALAGGDTTISTSLPLCETLWHVAETRMWLVAALMRKASLLVMEPDPACLEFLASKAIEALTSNTTERVTVSKEELADSLPALIQLMPDEIWQKPVNLWNCLLKTLREEYGVEGDAPPGSPDEHASTTVEQLALFCVDAIGSLWDRELDARLELWKGRPEYGWLVAFRHSASLDAMIETVHRQVSAASPFSHPALFRRICDMSPFERRRFLLLRESTTNKALWPQMEIDEIVPKIEWKFHVALRAVVPIDVYLSGDHIGAVEIRREADGGVVVEKASGICTLLRTPVGQTLQVKRAATDESGSLIALTDTLRGALIPLPEARVLLVFEWRPEGVWR